MRAVRKLCPPHVTHLKLFPLVHTSIKQFRLPEVGIPLSVEGRLGSA